MAKRYQLTARRRQALRKAQLASARKRSRNRKVKIAAVGAGVAGVLVARHVVTGSKLNLRRNEGITLNGKRLGPGTGGIAFRHKGMTSVGVRHRGKHKDTTLQYFHEPLNGKKIRSALGPAGKKIRSTRAGNQLAYKTRGIRGIRHPEIPYYRSEGTGNYGATGKRLTNLQVGKTYVGGKALKTKDLFGNLVRGSR